MIKVMVKLNLEQGFYFEIFHLCVVIFLAWEHFWNAPDLPVILLNKMILK